MLTLLLYKECEIKLVPIIAWWARYTLREKLSFLIFALSKKVSDSSADGVLAIHERNEVTLLHIFPF